MVKPWFVALLALLPAVTLADVALPDTKAGQAFGAWLEAFNSGDRARLESFTRTFAPSKNADEFLRWRADTGPYELLEIFAADPRNVFFHVKSRTNGGEEAGRMTLSANRPAAVTELGTWRIPAGAKPDAVPLDSRTRARLVDAVAEAFEDFYVYPETGKKMSEALRKHEARGDYRSLLYGPDLARKLGEDLREISHDKHADVWFSYFVKPVKAAAKAPGMQSRRLIAVNCGFEKAEHLPPNVGYLKFNLFGDPKACAPEAGAAMTLLSDSDALILDLRENHGGAPGMVEFIASYLFDERTHLDDTYSRASDATTESWTLPYVPGKKFPDKPVFILVSHQTFSAAEALSYSLKNLGRATVIGETTQGGAHPTDSRPIDDHFSARVPHSRSINPITHTNWEGVGVEPDVKVPAERALDVALELAVSGHDR